MRQRVVSALVGLVILAVVLAFLNTLVFNLVIMAICIIAVRELLNATGCAKFKGLQVAAVLMAVAIPFVRAGYVRHLFPQILFILILSYFGLLLKNHDKMRVEQMAMAFFFSAFVPVFFSCAVFIRDDFGPVVGGYYLLLALGSGWLSDTGAYFTGLRFGKRKLAKHISPKKTVEGAIGGIVICTVFTLLIAWGYSAGMAAFGYPVRIYYLRVGLLTPLFSAIGMMGDLSASVIKRHFDVKDYGHIMPGHGGVLDRFDSVLFTLPCVYSVVQLVTLAVSL